MVFSRQNNGQSMSIYVNGAKCDCVQNIKHVRMWLT